MTSEQYVNDWGGPQESVSFTLWASAAVDEILSARHERLLVGPPVG